MIKVLGWVKSADLLLYYLFLFSSFFLKKKQQQHTTTKPIDFFFLMHRLLLLLLIQCKMLSFLIAWPKMLDFECQFFFCFYFSGVLGVLSSLYGNFSQLFSSTISFSQLQFYSGLQECAQSNFEESFLSNPYICPLFQPVVYGPQSISRACIQCPGRSSKALT